MSTDPIATARQHLSAARAALEAHKAKLRGDDVAALAEVCTAITDVRDRLDEFKRRYGDG